jgi:hypothetical protein
MFSCQIKSSDPLLAAGTANVEMRKKMEKMLREVQDHVCRSVEEVDGVGKFQRDVWSREDGGGGVSAVMGGGKVPFYEPNLRNDLMPSLRPPDPIAHSTSCARRCGRRPGATLPSSTAPCPSRRSSPPTTASSPRAARPSASTTSRVLVPSLPPLPSLLLPSPFRSRRHCSLLP